jgi:hypothetical protein
VGELRDARDLESATSKVTIMNSRNKTLMLLAAVAGTAAVNGYLAKRAERRYPPEGEFLMVRGTRLHYLDQGPRNAATSPVVLLHGNGATT